MLKEICRLHMNEMPYPPPRRVREAAREGIGKLNRYADPEEIQELRELVAQYVEVSPHHVVLSPGSDLLLREIVHSFSQGRKVVTVSPTFLPTVEAVGQFTSTRVSIMLGRSKFDLDHDLLARVLDKPSLLIIDNPNNPTGGMLLDRDTVEGLLANPDVHLVVDEAYHEYSGRTFVDLVPDNPRFAVTRTMDKAFSLAGARVGYAVLGEAFLDAFSAFCEFLPQPSLYVAKEALRDPVFMQDNVRKIIQERERMREVLEGMHENCPLRGRVYPSNTNFLLLNTQIPDVAEQLWEYGVLVSDVSHQLPAGFIRVTVGTGDEIDAFLSIYRKILDSSE